MASNDIPIREQQIKTASGRVLSTARVGQVVESVPVTQLRTKIYEQGYDVVKLRCWYNNPNLFRDLEAFGFPYGVSVVNRAFTADLVTTASTKARWSGLTLAPYGISDSDSVRVLMTATWRERTFTEFASPFAVEGLVANVEQAVEYALSYAEHDDRKCGFLLRDRDGKAVGITYGYFQDDVFHQEYVGVPVNERGNGYGGALYDLLDAWLMQQGCFKTAGNISIDNLPSTNALLNGPSRVQAHQPYVHVALFPYLSYGDRDAVEFSTDSDLGDAELVSTISHLPACANLRLISLRTSQVPKSFPSGCRLRIKTLPVPDDQYLVVALVQGAEEQAAGAFYMLAATT